MGSAPPPRTESALPRHATHPRQPDVAERARARLVDLWTDSMVALAGWLALLALALALFALSTVTKQLPEARPLERQPSQLSSPRSHDVASRQHEPRRDATR